jgi:hypothetical protein
MEAPMSDDLLARFAAARDETRAVTLSDPAALRRVGTRRTRVRFGALALAAFVAVGVVAVGVNRWLPSSAPQRPIQPSPSVSVAPTPSTSPTPSLPPPVTFNDDECARTPAACYPPAIEAHLERLPAPCATINHPSNGLIVARHSEQKLGSHNSGPDTTATTYGRTLTRYRDNGATMYLAEVRDAVGRCSSVTRSGTRYRYRQVRTGFAGDESVMLSRTFLVAGVAPGEAPKDTTFTIAIVRIADVVVVIYDYGWEGAPTEPSQVDLFLAKAIDLVRTGEP